ncbi:MAG: hypothetical protein U0802_22325 [Candidatus Binatia bacterium]
MVCGGGENPSIVLHGYDVTMLIDICKAIIQAGQMAAYWLASSAW